MQLIEHARFISNTLEDHDRIGLVKKWNCNFLNVYLYFIVERGNTFYHFKVRFRLTNNFLKIPVPFFYIVPESTKHL